MIELRLEGDLEDFLKEKQDRFFNAIKGLLKIEGGLKIVNIQPSGSIILISLGLPSDQAKKLLQEVKSGTLKKYGVVNAEFRDESVLKVSDGKIYIITSISIAPFFEKKIEREFYKVRLHKDWGEFVGFDKKEKNTLLNKVKGIKGIFTHDEDERISEKIGYNIESFRGITYEELFTPIYQFKKDKFENEKERLIEEINLVFSQNEDETYKKTLEDVLEKINEEIIKNNWIIKIKITKDGLATIFFEKTMDNKNKNIIDYADEVRRLTNKSYLIERLECKNGNVSKSEIERTHRLITENKLLESEGIFSSLLNASAILITYMLLREYKVYDKVAEILKKNRRKDYKDYLKYPWNVRYTSFASFSHRALPLRNYFIVYHFYDIKGIEDHFDCPDNLYDCPKKDKCFIRKYGNLLLSLSKNLFKVDTVNKGQPLVGEFTLKEIENIAKRDLARWKGELCLVESESIIICSPKKFEILMAGSETEYNRYWENIIKGFSLLLECKTLAQIISRLLYECMLNHRNKEKNIKEIQNELSVISNLLSRTRLTATPSNIARATYVRDKFDEFQKVIGLPGIIDNVEKDYQEINEVVSSSIDSESTDVIRKLTFLLVPLTILIVIGTIILIQIEVNNPEIEANNNPIKDVIKSNWIGSGTSIKYLLVIFNVVIIISIIGWLKKFFQKLKDILQVLWDKSLKIL